MNKYSESQYLEYRNFSSLEKTSIFGIILVWPVLLFEKQVLLIALGFLLILIMLISNQLARIPIIGMLFGIICAFTSIIVIFAGICSIIGILYYLFPIFTGTVAVILGFAIVIPLAGLTSLLTG